MFDLNEGQELAKKVVLGVINRSNKRDDKFATFKGPAGSGKTFTLQQIIHSIPPYMTIGLTAPTHKATKVIRKMAYRAGIDGQVDIRTIHSALGLTMKQVDGDEVLERDPYAEQRYYDVLFIDEAGMCGDELLGYIIDSPSQTIIFIGDEYQIGPVDGEVNSISKVFTEVATQAALTEIVRQGAGNPIIELATKLRECQDDIELGWPDIVTNLLEDGGGVEVLDRNTWFQQAVEQFKSDEFKADPDFARCVAYTNSQVDIINRAVRQTIHGRDVPEYLVGEILVAQSAGKMHKNAEEMEIIELEQIDHELYNLPCWRMTLSSIDTDSIYRVNVLKGEYTAQFQDKLSKLSTKARMDKGNARAHWQEFWALKKEFDVFKHVYAMTAHKSQGSTFNQTFVYTPDFLKFGATPAVKRLMYTATTRSSFKTIFAY